MLGAAVPQFLQKEFLSQMKPTFSYTQLVHLCVALCGLHPAEFRVSRA